MSIRKGFPWFVIVLTAAGGAHAQSTAIGNATTNAAPIGTQTNIRSLARDGRALTIGSSDEMNVDAAPQVTEFHTVERGDTLWDITGRYFQNPWRWPAIWGLNPQITNPHWIFPHDQVRLLRPEDAPRTPVSSDGGLRLAARVAPGTIFLRDEGFLDRREIEYAGTIVGSPEDQLLLSEGDHAYVEFRRRTPRTGEQYVVYQEGQRAAGGDERNEGRVVRIIGSLEIESWDSQRRIASARINESLDGIERGERVALMPRELHIVPTRSNEVNLRANIVATTQPRELVGTNMIVYLNRGSNDRVRAGNRFSVVRRGDAWRRSLTTSAELLTGGSGLDRDGDGNPDTPPGRARADRNFPAEVVAEVLVVEVRERSCIGIVTSSVVEVQVGDVLEMRAGY